MIHAGAIETVRACVTLLFPLIRRKANGVTPKDVIESVVPS